MPKLTAAELRDSIHELADSIVEQLACDDNRTMQSWSLHDVKELLGAAIQLAGLVAEEVKASSAATPEQIRDELGTETLRLIVEGRARMWPMSMSSRS